MFIKVSTQTQFQTWPGPEIKSVDPVEPEGNKLVGPLTPAHRAKCKFHSQEDNGLVSNSTNICKGS